MPNDPRNQSGGQIPRGTHEDTKILGTPGAVDDAFERALPRSGIYVQPIDQILINLSAPLASGTLILNYRLLLPDGTIQVAQETFNFTGGGAGQLKTIAVIEGWLLSCTCQLRTANISNGSIYVEVYLIRGATGNLLWPTQLIADYFSSFQTLAWPNNIVKMPTEGRGLARLIAVGAPGAGTDWAITPSQNLRTRLRGVFFDLITSAAAGNRNVRLRIGSNLIHITSAFTQVASTTIHYSFAGGMPYNSTDSAYGVTAPLPAEMEWGVEGTLSVGTESGGLLAADQFSNIFLLVAQWHEND